MLIRRPANIAGSEITPRPVFEARRRLVGSAVALGALAMRAAAAAGPAAHAEDERPTALADFTAYNNYAEFSSDKKAVRVLAQALTLEPWTVTVDGEVENPFTVDMAGLKRLFGEEERIYRLRCVEGWSAVVPWNGFALSRLIGHARPTSRARHVEFTSLKRGAEMIGQRLPGGLDWPYREALRIDEATHPLAFAVTGHYGVALSRQCGAPLRVAVPWKYGFKSPKAIVRIRLTQERPATSWSTLAPSEYGFFGNVDPEVAHPRWSQARETRLGEMRKRPTLPFNGYADQVARLYAGMDPQQLR